MKRQQAVFKGKTLEHGLERQLEQASPEKTLVVEAASAMSMLSQISVQAPSIPQSMKLGSSSNLLFDADEHSSPVGTRFKLGVLEITTSTVRACTSSMGFLVSANTPDVREVVEAWARLQEIVWQRPMATTPQIDGLLP